MQEALKDVILDVKRVSSESAPHKSGYLEKNRYTVSQGRGQLEGTVSFRARNKKFDYARWTHDERYNLGEKSLRKSGGSSKYGSGTIPVGTGYLSNTIKNNEKGYLNYFDEVYKKTLSD